MDSRTNQDPGVRRLFPPDVVVQIKALACELPFENGIPLSRWKQHWHCNRSDLARHRCQISGITVWRWLDEDAIKPWQHRSWIFPRDPEFKQKAGRILDLYHGVYQGKALKTDEYVLSADEKTSIQARCRKHETLPAKSEQCMKVEHEYERLGSVIIWRLGMSNMPKSLDVAKPKPALKPLTGLSAMSWDKSLMHLQNESFGLLIMVLLTEVRLPSKGCNPNGQTLS